MVDTYGRWYEEKDYTTYPKEKWCDYDHIAAWIHEVGYQIKTSMGNIITMMFIHYVSELDDLNEEFTIEGCKNYVKNSGGFAMFDYYA